MEGLEDQGRGARGPDVDPQIARFELARSERQVSRAGRASHDLGTAQERGGLDRLEVLGPEARLVPVGPDLDDPERLGRSGARALSAVRRIWPPPSPLEPSRVINLEPGSDATTRRPPSAPRLDPASNRPSRPHDEGLGESWRAWVTHRLVDAPELSSVVRPVQNPGCQSIGESLLECASRGGAAHLTSSHRAFESFEGIGIARTARSGSLLGLAVELHRPLADPVPGGLDEQDALERPVARLFSVWVKRKVPRLLVCSGRQPSTRVWPGSRFDRSWPVRGGCPPAGRP